jgi:hypothetical protein
MTTAAIKKKISETIKSIDDVAFLNNIHQIIFDKASRTNITITDEDWDIIEARSRKAKKNVAKLKSWKEVKKNLLAKK